jgi:predicted nucleic acid-binding protein
VVTALLDTNIVIDLLNGYPPATQWLLTQTGLALTRSVWLEVIEGVENKIEMGQTTTFLDTFGLIELAESDFDWATQQLIRYKLSHNVDAFDCLIAAPSYRLQLPLFTCNLKHFAPLLGKLAQEPYS